MAQARGVAALGFPPADPACQGGSRPRALIGRLLFALVFISSALNKLSTFGNDGGPTIGYMKPKLDAAKLLILKQTGGSIDLNVLPLQDKHFLAAAIALEGLGGLLFVFNNDLGAKLLVVFLALVTPIMHDFWNVADQTSSAYLIDMIMFFKNLSIFGALLFYLAMKKEARLLVSPVARSSKAHRD